jgi:transcription elongation factor Elf1
MSPVYIVDYEEVKDPDNKFSISCSFCGGQNVTVSTKAYVSFFDDAELELTIKCGQCANTLELSK